MCSSTYETRDRASHRSGHHAEFGGDLMRTSQLIPLVIGVLIGTVAQAQTAGDIARGNMHFDAKDIDSNGDHMISKDEFMRYGETMWERMARAENVSIPVVEASQQFARGNLRFDAKAMDTDGDGKITKEEFMKYGEKKFDAEPKDAHGMVSVADAGHDFARGNVHPTAKAPSTENAPAPR